jgi:hypothetical protein
MKALIVKVEATIKAEGFNKVWQTFLSTDDKPCFDIEAEQDLIKNNISYEVGDVEIKIEKIIL